MGPSVYLLRSDVTHYVAAEREYCVLSCYIVYIDSACPSSFSSCPSVRTKYPPTVISECAGNVLSHPFLLSNNEFQISSTQVSLFFSFPFLFFFFFFDIKISDHVEELSSGISFDCICSELRFVRCTEFSDL